MSGYRVYGCLGFRVYGCSGFKASGRWFGALGFGACSLLFSPGLGSAMSHPTAVDRDWQFLLSNLLGNVLRTSWKA